MEPSNKRKFLLPLIIAIATFDIVFFSSDSTYSNYSSIFGGNESSQQSAVSCEHYMLEEAVKSNIQKQMHTHLQEKRNFLNQLMNLGGAKGNYIDQITGVDGNSYQKYVIRNFQTKEVSHKNGVRLCRVLVEYVTDFNRYDTTYMIGVTADRVVSLEEL